MVLLDWFFMGLLSLAMLCFMFVLFCLFYFFATKKELKKGQWRRRPKNKVKRKRWVRERRLLVSRQKRYFRNSLIFLVVMLLSAGSAAYARYYQLTNLTSDDAKVVVQGYLLTEDLEKKLTTIKEGGSIDKVYPQFQEVSSLLVTYGNRPVSVGLSEEGSKLLTRYYVSMKDVGMNLSTLTQEQLANKEILESYLKDISKIKERQKAVFTYFKVNESALKQKN
ncbi:hypothetical protein JZO66_03670 [Enterococcus sp. DIV0242_7C1]|uniref:Uncharacterized protein n=1 Tax=Candidatus Enterococcus dunnyi TaxID=1834192 RepID=A0A200JD10_9ENTE|nr:MULTISPECIES: hypothetical protein [unclassified Enterococcus]MBO0469632.1 hypothetical protein [Enterococcus sp. DIV0242_7C1]MCA5011838.1 hypothetical protein [Enterococcus sp. S23]MCA5014720.1 hypothetical protein [Enterococcus sp. S22(2020)]OUZ35078.1 hypothetical protein A5889_000553 [Enterococcus sp. 9D6_DIV0238]